MFPSTFTNQILTINQNNGVSISTNATKSVSYQVCKKTIRSITELKLLFVEETEKVISQRDILIAELKSFLKDGRASFHLAMYRVYTIIGYILSIEYILAN